MYKALGKVNRRGWKVPLQWGEYTTGVVYWPLWGNHEGEAWGTTGGDSQAEEGADDLRKGWAREGGEWDDRGDS